ncbi:ring-h2 finger protein atl51-related [Anaeramoeba flamelloides]|uniref:Ring-h2 finger protein atl51-related n=1 Tax=Anaeramoeba flamelloides TaxID=1746091 RepID=A0ABQ8Z9Y7_9EUKA|nr:ring-h2 finger protein atl51-related [Anaeramoeba flamelloides]
MRLETMVFQIYLIITIIMGSLRLLIGSCDDRLIFIQNHLEGSKPRLQYIKIFNFVTIGMCVVLFSQTTFVLPTGFRYLISIEYFLLLIFLFNSLYKIYQYQQKIKLIEERNNQANEIMNILNNNNENNNGNENENENENNDNGNINNNNNNNNGNNQNNNVNYYNDDYDEEFHNYSNLREKRIGVLVEFIGFIFSIVHCFGIVALTRRYNWFLLFLFYKSYLILTSIKHRFILFLNRLRVVKLKNIQTSTLDDEEWSKIVQNKEICTICREVLVNKEITLKLPCNHLFHCKCIKSWVDVKNTCPICNQQINDNSQQATNPKLKNFERFGNIFKKIYHIKNIPNALQNANNNN